MEQASDSRPSISVADGQYYRAERVQPNQVLINAEIGTEAKLTDNMSLRLVLSDKYDSEPADGIDENDLSLVASVSMKM